MSTPPTARLGVLAADGIHIEGMPHPLTARAGICRAPDLARCARTLGLTDLWLHPSLLPPHIRLCADWATPPDDSPWTIRANANKGTPDGALSHWYTAIQSGTYGVVNLCLMPQLPKGTPWLRAETGAALLSSLVAFRDALGTPWRRSAGATGTRLIREVHRGPHALTLDLPGEAPPPALSGGTETPLLWIRDLTPEERARKYLHSYDKNGMYLGAASSLALGFGQPEHTQDAAALWRAFEEKRPGYWLVRVDVQTAAHPLAPPAYRTPRRDGDPVWMTYPSLALLVQLGYGLTLLEGYIYPESHRALEPWYKRVRDARANVRDPLALDAVKDVYRMTFGWLGSPLWDRTGDELYRPDWRHANVAQARANMVRSWLKLHAAGVHPFACGTDSWLLASDEPDPVKACPSALVLGDGLAHWKVAHGGVPMADVLDVLDMRASGRLGRLQRWLNARDGRDEVAEATEAEAAEELVTA